MTESYGKLFNTILTSSIWQESDTTRLVWVTMIAMADMHGLVHAATPGLAHFARVELPECERALEVLLAPDPHSRTSLHEGRRIEVINGGWRLLNHGIYREKLSAESRREQNRRNQQVSRARKFHNADVSDCHQPSAASAHTDADTSIPKIKNNSFRSTAHKARGGTSIMTPAPAGFLAFWAAYPKRQKRADALGFWEQLGCEEVASQIVAHVELMKAQDDGWQRGYAPLPSTYLEGKRWSDEPQAPPRAEPSSTMQAITTLLGGKGKA